MELFREHGYDKTTVAEIAERAGLTRRTFFRYFTDKREVLFFGAEKLEAFLAASVVAAPSSTPAMEAVAAALDGVARASDELPGFADFARQRHALIRTCTELRERELIKLASLGTAMADALRRRGIAEPAARLAAGAGLTVFQVAFDDWVDGAKSRTLRAHVRDAVDGLKAVASGQAAVKARQARAKVTPTARRRPSAAGRSTRR